MAHRGPRVLLSTIKASRAPSHASPSLQSRNAAIGFMNPLETRLGVIPILTEMRRRCCCSQLRLSVFCVGLLWVWIARPVTIKQEMKKDAKERAKKVEKNNEEKTAKRKRCSKHACSA